MPLSQNALRPRDWQTDSIYAIGCLGVSHTLSYHCLFIFLLKDLRPSEGLHCGPSTKYLGSVSDSRIKNRVTNNKGLVFR